MGVIDQSAGEGIGGVIDRRIWWGGGIILSRKRLGGNARRFLLFFFPRVQLYHTRMLQNSCLQRAIPSYNNKGSSIIINHHREKKEKRLFVLDIDF